ncbi:MAG: S8 family serine peptidase [Bacteroidota bacterium]
MLRAHVLSLIFSISLSLLFSQELPYAPDRLLASLKPEVDVKASSYGLQFQSPSVESWLRTLGVKRQAPLTINRYLSSLPVLIEFETEVDIPAMIAELEASGLYNYVEPDYKGTGAGQQGMIPNDAYFKSRQWGLENDGTFNTKSVEDADIDMEEAWALTQGNSSIMVAILDSGIKPDHPEFAGRIWQNEREIPDNNIDDDLNGYIDDSWGWDFVDKDGGDSEDDDPTDDHGHGTNVAGILAANGNNGIGYAGVDWNCKLLIAKILDENNEGFYSWWIKGIYYAVDNGADVINMSTVGGANSPSLEEAIRYAYRGNVPVVVAMGNTNNFIRHYPAAYKESIAVGATDTDNQRASPFFWSHISGSNFGQHIDLVAPGNFMFGLSSTSNTDYDTYWGGTSQATPLVTGVISLMKSLDPTLSVDEVKNLLRKGTIDMVGAPNEDTRGWDRFHGSGLLNAYNSLLPLAATTSGDEELLSSKVSVFPNPGTGSYQVSFEDNPLGWQMTLLDMSGRGIKTWEQIPIGVALELDLPKGVYTMVFKHKQESTQFHKKLVHQQ